MILVSACLLGINCRYDGCNNKRENIINLVLNSEECFIPVCPEQLGGLSTPRRPVKLSHTGEEIIKGVGRVIAEDGSDNTRELLKGAIESLRLSMLYRVKKAILKSNSPSCGVYRFPIYSGEKSKGMGVTAALLKKHNIELLNEEDIPE